MLATFLYVERGTGGSAGQKWTVLDRCQEPHLNLSFSPPGPAAPPRHLLTSKSRGPPCTKALNISHITVLLAIAACWGTSTSSGERHYSIGSTWVDTWKVEEFCSMLANRKP